jgi:ribosomal peptide maturation radical SAM protein 1
MDEPRSHLKPLPSPDFSPGLPAPSPARIALVNMPFSMADRPSIQCGLLKSSLSRLGHEVDVHYLNLELAAELGSRFYTELAQLRTDLLLGDWLFSVAAFGPRDDDEEYRQSSPALSDVCQAVGKSFAELCQLRHEGLPAWIDRWVEAIDWSGYDAVGFTSTFEQNTASFALARAIKERYPQVVTLFGGANFDGDMGKEYVRALPFIDYVVVGEGDRALPALIERLSQGESPLGIPGVVGRRDGELVSGGPAHKVMDMDALPDPDYDEYFAALFRLGRERILGLRPPRLLVETSRGCWWGEKQHCTFCGLNANGMKFRAKSSTEATEQFRRLAGRYKILNFEAVDNIMDHKYIEQVCEPLAQQSYDYRFFYEVKANLTPAQLRILARAGIKNLQPGIESLSSHILSLMRKGITLLRNVRLLKWAHYYDINVAWNILTGFPGETEEDYRQQQQVLPLLRHLQPPAGANRIWLERFSPYFFDSSFPVSNVKPLGSYRFVYPEDRIDLSRIAYFFDYEMDQTLPPSSHEGLVQEVELWKRAWKRKPLPSLSYLRVPDWLQIVDRRTENATAHALYDQEAAIYEYCSETDRTVDAVRSHFEKQGETVAETEIRDALEKFCELGLMLHEKNSYLSLALPANPHR